MNRKDWSDEEYEYKIEIPGKYDNIYVYGIDMEDNLAVDKLLEKFKYDTILKKRMVLVLADNPRTDIIKER